MPKLDLHDHSEGAAETAVRWWLDERVSNMKEQKSQRLLIVTGWGKTREDWGTSDIKKRVENVLKEMSLSTFPSENAGVVLVKWPGSTSPHEPSENCK